MQSSVLRVVLDVKMSSIKFLSFPTPPVCHGRRFFISLTFTDDLLTPCSHRFQRE